MKNNNGITLVTLVLTIVLILLISGMMGYYTLSSLDLKDVNNMYSDLDILQNEVDNYYIKNNDLPVIGSSIEFSVDGRNVNDDDNEYYLIDLSKLGNLNLNYGSDFETLKTSSNIANSIKIYNDAYIINAESQTIYYYKGIKFEGKTYYFKPVEYLKVLNTNNNT